MGKNQMHRWATEIKSNIWCFRTKIGQIKRGVKPSLILPHIAESALTTGFWRNLSSFCTTTPWLISVRKGSLWEPFLRVQTSKLILTQSKPNPSTVCGHRLEKVPAWPKSSSYSSLDTYWQQIIDATPCSVGKITLCFQAVLCWVGFSVLPPKH